MTQVEKEYLKNISVKVFVKIVAMKQQLITIFTFPIKLPGQIKNLRNHIKIHFVEAYAVNNSAKFQLYPP